MSTTAPWFRKKRTIRRFRTTGGDRESRQRLPENNRGAGSIGTSVSFVTFFLQVMLSLGNVQFAVNNPAVQLIFERAQGNALLEQSVVTKATPATTPATATTNSTTDHKSHATPDATQQMVREATPAIGSAPDDTDVSANKSSCTLSKRNGRNIPQTQSFFRSIVKCWKEAAENCQEISTTIPILKKKTWIAVENLNLLNALTKHRYDGASDNNNSMGRLWNGRVQVVEVGTAALSGTVYQHRFSLAGSILNFFLGTGRRYIYRDRGIIAVTRYPGARFFREYRDSGRAKGPVAASSNGNNPNGAATDSRCNIRKNNYKYLPKGLEEWITDDMISPPGFAC